MPRLLSSHLASPRCFSTDITGHSLVELLLAAAAKDTTLQLHKLQTANWKFASGNATRGQTVGPSARNRIGNKFEFAERRATAANADAASASALASATDRSIYQ